MSYKILIIEDEFNLLALYKELLEDEGFDVTTSTNGKEGLSLALSQPFDLILLDLMLPGMSGLDILKELKKDNEINTKVAIVTNFGNGPQVGKAVNFGAADFILKYNTSPPKLIKKVKGLLATT